VPTEDGSLTLLDDETQELYHNRAGAFTEALVNYVTPSAATEILCQRGQLRVLDACFGLGYNSFVLLSSLLDPARTGTLEGVSIEITAIDLELMPSVVLLKVLADSRFSSLSPLLCDYLKDGSRQIPLRAGSLSIAINLIEGDLRAVVPALKEPFDVVFHDPFSPRKVPELWTYDLFEHYFRLLTPLKGKLLTYSAAKAVRSGLLQAGFNVWKTQALGGKSGGTMGTIAGESSAHAEALAEGELSILKSALPYRDPGLKLTRAEISELRLKEPN
jgi:tRNA U34 5-methylaminomethyl-2-thiouridine-forming methyltransferase MnmC